MLSSETNIKTPQTRTRRKTHRKAPDITTLHIYTRLHVLSLKLHVFVFLFFFVKDYNSQTSTKYGKRWKKKHKTIISGLMPNFIDTQV